MRDPYGTITTSSSPCKLSFPPGPPSRWSGPLLHANTSPPTAPTAPCGPTTKQPISHTSYTLVSPYSPSDTHPSAPPPVQERVCQARAGQHHRAEQRPHQRAHHPGAGEVGERQWQWQGNLLVGQQVCCPSLLGSSCWPSPGPQPPEPPPACVTTLTNPKQFNASTLPSLPSPLHNSLFPRSAWRCGWAGRGWWASAPCPASPASPSCWVSPAPTRRPRSCPPPTVVSDRLDGRPQPLQPLHVVRQTLCQHPPQGTRTGC